LRKTPRIFLPPSQFGETGVELRKRDLHYLRNVLRLRENQLFAALDGEGQSWLCEFNLKSICQKRDDFKSVQPLRPRLTMGVALCKGSRFENTIEKLAELGVHEFVPLLTERTARKAPSDSKFKRWEEIAVVSSALAYRLLPLKVSEVCPLEEFLQKNSRRVLYCHPGGAAAIEGFKNPTDELVLLIGPEGGFSSAEEQMLARNGRPIDLGPLNLRVETAAVVSAALALNLCPKECKT
jgi:16S rRNA (uracil1498-N3)-methyltransferase